MSGLEETPRHVVVVRDALSAAGLGLLAFVLASTPRGTSIPIAWSCVALALVSFGAQSWRHHSKSSREG